MGRDGKYSVYLRLKHKLPAESHLAVPKRALYSQLARYYDRFYWWKDYTREVDFLLKAFEHYGVTVKQILEVACGTGNHTQLLAAKGFHVTGLDISEDVLRIARLKVGSRADFLHGDMRDLQSLPSRRTYDAVICLFSSISYNTTSSDLKKTVRGMYYSVRPGGIVVFDTHFTDRGFLDGYRGEDIFDDGKVMGARLSTSKREANLGEISFSYLIKDGRKTILLRDDVHRLGLFSERDFASQMKDSGLTKVKVFHDWALRSKGKREQFSDSIFVGVRPLA
jgi:SAM-dependent methyltransferase